MRAAHSSGYAKRARHDRVVGIGETGLDYFKIDSDDVRRNQRNSFAAHLDLAREALAACHRSHARGGSRYARTLAPAQGHHRRAALLHGVLGPRPRRAGSRLVRVDIGYRHVQKRARTFETSPTRVPEDRSARRNRLSVACTGSASRQDERTGVRHAHGAVSSNAARTDDPKPSRSERRRTSTRCSRERVRSGRTPLRRGGSVSRPSPSRDRSLALPCSPARRRDAARNTPGQRAPHRERVRATRV